jgi:hypothetical protein
MDPKKRVRKAAPSEEPKPQNGQQKFGEETEADREKALADAEWKNLWDATEVIDMDKW